MYIEYTLPKNDEEFQQFFQRKREAEQQERVASMFDFSNSAEDANSQKLFDFQPYNEDWFVSRFGTGFPPEVIEVVLQEERKSYNLLMGMTKKERRNHFKKVMKKRLVQSNRGRKKKVKSYMRKIHKRTVVKFP